nr:ATP-binding protein [Paenibacillus sp. NEAU-GSW1]
MKETLIQFIISLMPVFAFQLWHNRERSWSGIPAFLTIVSCISMVFCMLVSVRLNGYDLNFRMVPLVIGTLYGGPYAMFGLISIYICFRIPNIDNFFELSILVIFILSYIPAMLLIMKSFQRARRESKQRIAILSLGAFVILYYITSLAYLIIYDLPLLDNLIFTSLLQMVGSIAAVWVSVFIIESLKENRQLHFDLKRISVNHRREVEKLQQFIDETAFAVMLVNHHGRITHLNEMGYRLFHAQSNIHERDEIVGKYFTAFFHSTHQETDIKLLREALKGNNTQLETVVEDGRTLVKNAFPIRQMPDGLIITGAAIIAQDVSELFLLRSEVDRMERLSLVGQMAASITHEIRNPMAVIRGFVQLLKERSPDNQQQYYHIIIEELDRANSIISDFLSLAQNRALTMEMGSLHDIILELSPLLDADANMRGQTIELELCDYIPLLLLNNKEIKQLLLNLARNGMEAMGDKGVLKLQTNYSEEKERIELRIQDRGVGIPQEQMKRLFEPFFTTKTRGTGLGLPLCLSIAERHNGKIEVESTEGEGTTFIVSFNRKTA